ncbi:MAG: dTDP-glucose 4,6-dehydratase [Candidatus Omnitrophota bacterium]
MGKNTQRKKILITGGAGFIGSAFIRLIASRSRGLNLGYGQIIIVDKLTYAGSLKRLKEVKGSFKFYKTDICDKKAIERIFTKEKPQAVVHFAAETHVDRSIKDGTPFIETNVKGTHVLLEASRKFCVKKFIFISTDEVYGELKHGKFNENSPFKPNSPYAVSKAAADLLVQAYIRTYNFPAMIVRPCNNFGPWQYPEKLIPVAISRALKNKKIPIYAKGENVREWLYVDDCVEAILKVAQKGKIGQAYNIGSGNERKNIAVVKCILDILAKPHSLIEFVADRPGHDVRYCLDASKIKRTLGWQPRLSFGEGIENTIIWHAFEGRE